MFSLLFYTALYNTPRHFNIDITFLSLFFLQRKGYYTFEEKFSSFLTLQQLLFLYLIIYPILSSNKNQILLIIIITSIYAYIGMIYNHQIEVLDMQSKLLYSKSIF